MTSHFYIVVEQEKCATRHVFFRNVSRPKNYFTDTESSRLLSNSQLRNPFLTTLFIWCVSAADGTTAFQPQSFNVKPSNVSVHEGGEALLLCQVANRGGQVQWVKDGLALGEYISLFTYSTFLRCTRLS